MIREVWNFLCALSFCIEAEEKVRWSWSQETEFLFSILLAVTLNDQVKYLVSIIYNEVLFSSSCIPEKRKQVSIITLEQLNIFYTVVKCIWYKMCPFSHFQVYSSVVLSVSSLCNHHHHTSQNFFIFPNWKSVSIKQ